MSLQPSPNVRAIRSTWILDRFPAFRDNLRQPPVHIAARSYRAGGIVPLYAGRVVGAAVPGAPAAWQPTAAELVRLSQCLYRREGYPGNVDASPPCPGTTIYYSSSVVRGACSRFRTAFVRSISTYHRFDACALAAGCLVALLFAYWRVPLISIYVLAMLHACLAWVAVLASPTLGRQVTYLSVGAVRRTAAHGGGLPVVGLERDVESGVPSLTDTDLCAERPSLGRDGEPYTGPEQDPHDGHVIVRCPCEADDDEAARELALVAHERGGPGACPVRDLRPAVTRAMDPCVPLFPDLRECRTVVVGETSASLPVVHVAGYYSEALLSYLLDQYRSFAQRDAASVAAKHRSMTLNLGEDRIQVLDNTMTVWAAASTTYDLLTEVRGGRGNF